ncbi:Gfo/Idh/MocA family oxidoreductase [Bifidobacterium sp. 82T25]|nr:Gfo/Idh/MocA family oxidoreductase [Bifidobacterium miconisargentati]
MLPPNTPYRTCPSSKGANDGNHPIRAAIIGGGAISDAYLTNLTSRFKGITAIACTDLDEPKSRAQAERYGIRALSVEQVFEDPTVDMVANLTPPAAHATVIRQALEHGKHVFSEYSPSLSQTLQSD